MKAKAFGPGNARSGKKMMHPASHGWRTPGWNWMLAGLLCAGDASASGMSIIPPPSVDAVPSELARRHQALLETATRTRTDSALCAVMSSAEQARQQLGARYQQRWDVLIAGPSTDGDQINQIARDAVEAQRQLPGVGLAIGAETFYRWVRYDALGPYAPQGSASARALLLAGQLWDERAGRAIYFEPATDISGCMRPAAALPRLRALAALWPALAPCVKQQLGPKMVEAVDEMANAGCYCAGKTETNAALKKMVPLRGVFAGGSKAVRTRGMDGQSRARRYSCQ